MTQAKKKKVVYVAHPLGDGPDRAENCRRASKWVAWAADQGVAPVCTWIVLASQWDESRREEGLAVDLALIEKCDEVWAVGPRVSKGMGIEIAHAKRMGVQVHVLVDPRHTEGPPTYSSTFEMLKARYENPMSSVEAGLRAIADRNGISYDELLKLSTLQALALHHCGAKPVAKKLDVLGEDEEPRPPTAPASDEGEPLPTTIAPGLLTSAPELGVLVGAGRNGGPP
jgi:hypothetical protein